MTGSARSREQTFHRYIVPEIEVLLRVARTLTGSWADAEDVVQETLMRAWRAADRFDGAQPRAWLLTIMRRAHRNTLRSPRPELPGHDWVLEGGGSSSCTAREPSAEDRVIDGTLNARLQHAVAELDPRLRAVLLLVDVHQLSYAEAARALGVPDGTVTSRLSRARAQVRAQLRGHTPRHGRTR
ncbi:MAG: RNA polymerase sigma factor [Sciscionella sp.]